LKSETLLNMGQSMPCVLSGEALQSEDGSSIKRSGASKKNLVK
jgi:hypothetical protein